MIIKIVLKNIKNSFKNFRKIYLLLVISQLVSILSIFLIYGIFGNYSAKMKELDMDSYMIGTYFEEVNIGELKECLPEVLDQIENKVDYVFVGGYSDEIIISMYAEYNNGEYTLSKTLMESHELEDGRIILDRDVIKGNNVLYSKRIAEDKLGDKISISGTEFEVVGIDSREVGDVEISFNACPDEVNLMCVCFNFKQLPTSNDYNEIKDTFESAFGMNFSIDEFELQSQEEIISYRTVIIISIAIGVVSALNTCLLYGYIIRQRRKQMAVYGIIGAAKGVRLAINEAEIMFINLVTVGVGFVVFHFGIEKMIMAIYESSLELYNVNSYLMLMGIYIICIFIFTLVQLMIINRDKLADMLRRTYND